MKQTSRLSIALLLLIISFTACKEDNYIDWKVKNQIWLENNKNQPEIKNTESGLQYKVIYQGWPYNRQPNKNSQVFVNYKGTLIDGTTFDSGTNVRLSLSGSTGVIAGLREGITKMNGGGTYIFYVPSELGYGNDSKNTKIPPHSTLIFEIDLIDSRN